jgi:hypothetical protein
MITLQYPGGLLSAFPVALLLWLSRKLHGDLHDMLPFLRYSFVLIAHSSLIFPNLSNAFLFPLFYISFLGWER